MSARRTIAYLAHTFRSDWNNGNAHFLRGLMRALVAQGDEVKLFEPEHGTGRFDHLKTEADGQRSLDEFNLLFPELHISTYADDVDWRAHLQDCSVVILHEWNPPELAQTLLKLRDELEFTLLFHDTHHRASSTPEQIARFGLERFDGVLAFGESLRRIYRKRFGLQRVWTFHEAADTTIFHPIAALEQTVDAVWIGNWGEGERSAEIQEFFLTPAAELSEQRRFKIYGVRYPQEGLDALHAAKVQYGGYLPNLDAPGVYAGSALTVHIPRQQYSSAMIGIPTIRVFEALACGIPLISAPWRDEEQLFRPGDFRMVTSSSEMVTAIRQLLDTPELAEAQAAHGLETVLARHTCAHRAQQLSKICEELNV